MTQRVLFLCGSPRGKRSARLHTARYLTRFLDCDYEFVNVARAKLSTGPSETGPAFLKVMEKMQAADAVIWTFGAWVLFVPVQMQYLLDKLFAQGYNFSDKIAAAVMTSARAHDDFILDPAQGSILPLVLSASARAHDDFILDRVRFVSEQLGFGYIGDVSAVGNPFFGYVDDEEATENSCRVLAGQINRALTEGYIPRTRNWSDGCWQHSSSKLRERARSV